MSEMGMAMMGSGKAQGEERAKVAAEAAISSPLLEDVNLSGARGILVNITAGMDLSIGEFDEVGRTVKEFASDNATVVVGTVIDPEMSGDIRVTIVATGLGNIIKEDAKRIKLVQENALGVDYKDFERPTVMRNQAPEVPETAETSDEVAPSDTEYLDIPAFLRRQAD
jgi:cell division protein FtsZ